MNLEVDESGNAQVFPLTGYGTFIPFQMMCGIHVQYAKDEASLLSGNHEAIPLIMTPPQARDVAQALLKAADAAECPGAGADQ